MDLPELLKRVECPEPACPEHVEGVEAAIMVVAEGAIIEAGGRRIEEEGEVVFEWRTPASAVE